MTDLNIAAIVQAASRLPIEEQGYAIATETIKAVRAADAAIDPAAIEDDFRAWWKSQGWPTAPGVHAVTTHKAYGQHLLSRGLGGH
jgi:hypothetical protein